MIHSIGAGGEDLGYYCLSTRYCRKQEWKWLARLQAIREQARADERHIVQREDDFSTYTQELVDLHARRAREEVRR